MTRVVITGVGCVTPLGNTYDEVVTAMYSGTSGIKFNEDYQTSLARITVDVDSQFDRYDIAATDRFGRAAMLAYLQAKSDADTTVDGVYIGTGAGATYEVNKTILEYHENDGPQLKTITDKLSKNGFRYEIYGGTKDSKMGMLWATK